MTKSKTKKATGRPRSAAKTATAMKRAELKVKTLPLEWIEVRAQQGLQGRKDKPPIEVTRFYWHKMSRNGNIICGTAAEYETRDNARKAANRENKKLIKKLPIFSI